jgi:hypothetical protein
VPLLPSSLTIIDSYANHPVCINKGKVLLVSTNQKMNAHLKEVAGVCSINKELTCHTARRIWYQSHPFQLRADRNGQQNVGARQNQVFTRLS